MFIVFARVSCTLRAQFRTQLATLNLPKTLPVGTADAGSAFTNANSLAAGSDFIMANVRARALLRGIVYLWRWDTDEFVVYRSIRGLEV